VSNSVSQGHEIFTLSAVKDSATGIFFSNLNRVTAINGTKFEWDGENS